VTVPVIFFRNLSNVIVTRGLITNTVLAPNLTYKIHFWLSVPRWVLFYCILPFIPYCDALLEVMQLI